MKLNDWFEDGCAKLYITLYAKYDDGSTVAYDISLAFGLVTARVVDNNLFIYDRDGSVMIHAVSVTGKFSGKALSDKSRYIVVKELIRRYADLAFDPFGWDAFSLEISKQISKQG